jgi:hypothetical protein
MSDKPGFVVVREKATRRSKPTRTLINLRLAITERDNELKGTSD